MGQWQIRGADRGSGRDVGQIYDADTREQAADLAVNDGMLVETIELLADDNTLPIESSFDPVEPMDALELQLRSETREQRAEQRSNQHGQERGDFSAAIAPLDYGNADAQRRRGDGPVPRYLGLQIAGRVIRVFGFVYYLVTIVALGSAGWSFATGASPGSFGLDRFTEFLWPLGLGMTGAVLHGVGSACSALRDMARNSWR